MSETEKPVAIHITDDAHNNQFINCEVVGDVDAVKIDKNSHSNRFINFLHIVSVKKMWYESSLGFTILSILVAVCAGGILYWLGWN